LNKNPSYVPQKSFFFRIIAFFSRLQLRYLLQTVENSHLLAVIFVFIAGSTALGIITIAAYLSKLPLLFPPLGPSAFILFHTPMSETASPRNVILSHTMAVITGILAYRVMGLIYPESNLSDPMTMDLCRVIMIALSMGLIGVLMIAAKCVHPPAAASTLIAAMGYLTDSTKILGLLGAVVLLVLDAFIFNRILGGLPYPVWRADPKISRSYGLLAGIPDANATFWQQLRKKTFQHRRK